MSSNSIFIFFKVLKLSNFVTFINDSEYCRENVCFGPRIRQVALVVQSFSNGHCSLSVDSQFLTRQFLEGHRWRQLVIESDCASEKYVLMKVKINCAIRDVIDSTLVEKKKSNLANE